MKNNFTHVILSPHLDDAVLSCGGWMGILKEEKEKVQIITIFSGIPDSDINPSPLVSHIHSLYGDMEDIVNIRRKEDALSVGLMGADFRHLDFYDCIYRRDEKTGAYYILGKEDIFGDLKEQDYNLPEKIADRVNDLIPQSDNVKLYAPMAIGGHIDHKIVYMAAILLKERGFSLILYEDYPYSENKKNRKKTYQTLPGKFKYKKHRIRFSKETMNSKIHAIALYQSQLKMLFGGPDAMQAIVRKYSRKRGESFLIIK